MTRNAARVTTLLGLFVSGLASTAAADADSTKARPPRPVATAPT